MNYRNIYRNLKLSAGFDCRYKHDSVKNIKEIKQLKHLY